jgi:glycosyltransferase involved in cell wall biosynthesis
VDWPRFFSSVRQPIIWTLHDQHPYLGGFHYERDYEIAVPRLRKLDERFRRVKQAAVARHRGPLAVVGNSRWNTGLAQRSGVFPAETLFSTIYYPLDCDAYRPLDKHFAKAALGLPPNTFTIGFACTSVDNPRKGLGTLLETIGKLQARQTVDFNLLSFGRDPGDRARAEIRNTWSHLGFLHGDSAKAAAYSAMDVFVIPSLAEAFGQTSIEALACGTAVVGANVGGIPETLPPIGQRWLFQAGNAEELLHRLAAIMTSSDRSEIITQGRAHVIAQHSIRATAQAYAEIYRELLQRS